MPSARAVLKKRKVNTLLHGSDLPEQQRTIRVVIRKVEEAPEKFWPAPFILHIDPVLDGRTRILLNNTNAEELSEIDDNYQKWVGWTLVLVKVEVFNPTSEAMTFGLSLECVKTSKKQGKRS